MLTAIVGDKFLSGDVALLLEQGSSNHCGTEYASCYDCFVYTNLCCSLSTHSGECFTGQNSANRQILSRPLFPGTE